MIPPSRKENGIAINLLPQRAQRRMHGGMAWRISDYRFGMFSIYTLRRRRVCIYKIIVYEIQKTS